MMEDDKEPVYASKAKPWLKYYDEKYIHQSVPECSAFALVCRNNERHLGDTALEYYGRKFSYADLIVQIKKTAAALQALGVKKGDIITVVSVMTPEVVYTFYAADLLGATLNLVDPRYSAEGIREYIEEVESRLLICLNVVYPRCHQAAKRTSVERVVVLSPADSLPLAKAVGYKLTEPDKNRYASNVLRWKDFIAAGKGHSPAAAPYDPQHTCVVVHTGGTTGSPKGVMLTDYCFNALAQEFAAQSRLFHRGQKLLNVMPPFIAYGYSCGIHMPLVMGLHIIIIPNLDPDKLGALVWKYKPAHMFGVPTHYQQLAADPLLKNKDLSFIRNYAAGGDSLSLGAEQTVNRFLKAHGVEYPLAKGYGMTEVSSAATIAAGNVTKPGSVGIPMLNTVVSIFEPGTETELPIGQRGEICICTPSRHEGLLQQARGDRLPAAPPRGRPAVGAHRRYRLHGRGRLCVSGRPHQAHDHPARRLQGVPVHDRERHQPPPGRASVLRGGLRRYRPHPGTSALRFCGAGACRHRQKAPDPAGAAPAVP